jgi:predicted unusual protein kinase regulating ubiquinone biosynthesis (AarF/ABC1/UbiB family)
MLRELDFQNEGQNMIEVRRDLESSGYPATCPKVFRELVTPRVLVMEFIDGCKLNDPATLRRLGADPRELTRIVCDAMSHQM